MFLTQVTARWKLFLYMHKAIRWLFIYMHKAIRWLYRAISIILQSNSRREVLEISETRKVFLWMIIIIVRLVLRQYVCTESMEALRARSDKRTSLIQRVALCIYSHSFHLAVFLLPLDSVWSLPIRVPCYSFPCSALARSAVLFDWILEFGRGPWEVRSILGMAFIQVLVIIWERNSFKC